MTEQEAKTILKTEIKHHPECSIFYQALELAIKALEKQIPKKVIIPKWSPAKCPTCGFELSEHVYDGYYKHLTHLRRCWNDECGQKLLWGEEE